MFILVTPESLKITSLDKKWRSQIKRFSSFDDSINVYTAQSGRMLKTLNNLIITPLNDENFSQRSYMYMTNLSKTDLMLMKLSIPFGCKVFITSLKFVESVLPLLDILLFTSSMRESVEMDIWIPTEQREDLGAIFNKLMEKHNDASLLIKRSSVLYNKHAPEALLEMKIQQRLDYQRGVTPRPISRYHISRFIRNKFIANNIITYLVYSKGQLGEEIG